MKKSHFAPFKPGPQGILRLWAAARTNFASFPEDFSNQVLYCFTHASMPGNRRLNRQTQLGIKVIEELLAYSLGVPPSAILLGPSQGEFLALSPVDKTSVSIRHIKFILSTHKGTQIRRQNHWPARRPSRHGKFGRAFSCDGQRQVCMSIAYTSLTGRLCSIFLCDIQSPSSTFRTCCTVSP